jgi:ethanolamine utilization protein EutP (predicted NTPase)
MFVRAQLRRSLEPRLVSFVASASVTPVSQEACMGLVSKLDMASTVNIAAIGVALAFMGAIVLGFF